MVHVGDTRERRRPDRVAEGEVVLLDGQDVCEVRAQLEGDVERERLHALVLDNDQVLHALADEPVPRDRDGVVRQPPNRRVAEVERRGEVLDDSGREQQRLRAVHGQAEQREEARVVGEEALRLAVDVAALVADAERRAFEDRVGHQCPVQ